MSIATEIERLQNAKANIKTAIEGKGVTVGDGTIDTFADKIREIPTGDSDGYEQGYADGEAAGIEQGKQAEYDRFWDIYQENGNRVNYAYGFGGRGWTKETFRPKYDIIPTTSTNIFINVFEADNEPVDLVTLLNECGVILDFSKCANVQNNWFTNANISRLGEINISKVSSAYQTFKGSSLVTIEKLTFGKNTVYNQTFRDCDSLINITVEGEIGKTIDFSDSPLSKVSIISVMTALSTTTSGTTASFNKAAVDNAFETAEGLADGSTSQEWLDLVATKPNWTISLI